MKPLLTLNRWLSLALLGLYLAGCVACAPGTPAPTHATPSQTIAIQPAPTQTLEIRPTATPSPSPMATATFTPTATRPPPSPTPSAAATATLTPTCTATPTVEPTATAILPTATHTPQPTTTPQVAPTVTSAETSAGAASASANHTFSGQVVDPPWWPCAQGQIKTNRNSSIYHVPGGAFYDKTYADVWCVDSEAQAVAGGFRKSKR